MLRNTTVVWAWPAKLLHWIAAIAILILLVHGGWMTHMAPRPDRLTNYNWHAALGYDLLLLVILRMLWRWANPVPALPSDLQPWERVAARASHVGLYLLMLGASVTGWALAATFRTPMTKDLFGLPVPQIVASQDRSMHALFEQSHTILSYLLVALVVVHLVASFRHHFIKHNDVLRRMWFAARTSDAPIDGAAARKSV
jgi:cytochrome b561